jgi:hypothetical protein
MTSAVLVGVKGEVLHSGNPQAKLVGVKAEVLHPGYAHPKLVATKIEVLHSIAVLSIPTSHRRITVVVSF